MKARALHGFFSLATLLALWAAYTQGAAPADPWQREFGLSKCNLVTTGRNDYFVLQLGFQLVLEGGGKRMQITVLNDTKTVDGVLTRVVEEREIEEGRRRAKSHAITSRSASRRRTCSTSAKDVDIYENGKVVKHEGAWLAGVNGNKPGLIMPGTPKVGMRYYQEIAPGVAMDRAEIVSVNDTCKTPAGTFPQVHEGEGNLRARVLRERVPIPRPRHRARAR